MKETEHNPRIVFIGGGNNTGDLYTIDKAALGWDSPISMGSHVNSRYLESTASVTPDDTDTRISGHFF